MAACDPSTLARCSIDLFQGPVLAPARATGLAGAFAAYAEGVDAIASNAAAVAVRPPYSFSWFDYDLSLGISFPAALRNNDFDNDGAVGFTYRNFVFYNLAAELQFGPWGIGFLGDFQDYDLLPAKSADDPQVTESLGRLHVVGGRSFLGGQLSIGGGVRGVELSIDARQNGEAQKQLEMVGVAPEVGVLVRPDYLPWRLGATFRSPVEGRITTATDPSANLPVPFVAPASILLPWELELGATIQVGPRPLNPRWIDPHEEEARERRQLAEDRAARLAAQNVELDSIADPGKRSARSQELAYQETFVRSEEDRRFDDAKKRLLAERRARFANWPRERIAVMIDLLVSGKSDDAIGLESFFAAQQSVSSMVAAGDFRRSGQRITYSPRLGLEGEPVPDRLQTRIGTYIEPSRFGGLARQHFTFGFDVKLFPWSVFGLLGDQTWRIGGVADLAPRYQSFGLSLGAWH